MTGAIGSLTPDPAPPRKRAAKAKTKPTCRCEPSSAAKKKAAEKKTAAKAARKVPRSAKTAAKKTAHARAGTKKTAAIRKSAAARKAVAKLSAGHHGKGHPSASSAPAKHAKTETHCQCNKTSKPRPRGTTPRH